MHLENSTAPPEPQVAEDAPRGVVWFTVDQIYPHLRIQGAPILNKRLAVELWLALRDELPETRVVIQGCAGDEYDFQRVQAQAARNHDLILSCRTAARPGHEYLARMGQLGRYENHAAPQNEQLPFRGAQPEGGQ